MSLFIHALVIDKHKIAFLIRILVGLLFCYAGLIKLESIALFEYSIVQITNISLYLSPYFTRFIIGIEFVLGIYLIIGWQLKSRTIPILISMLVLFIGIFLYGFLFQINLNNCGCFGDKILMSPTQSILKNIILIILLIIVYKLKSTHEVILDKFNDLFYFIFLSFFWLILLITHPIKKNSINNKNPSTSINLEPLYLDSVQYRPKVNLRKGKWIVGFLSTNCNHCKIAAKELSIMKQQNASLPFYVIMVGDESQLEPFVSQNLSSTVPYHFMRNLEHLLQTIIVPQIPVFYYIENGQLKQKLKYTDLSYSDLNAWMLYH